MSRVLATLGGVLILALLAAGLTEASLAIGGRGTIANDALLRPIETPSPTVTAKPKSTPIPSPSISPSPSPTPDSTSSTTPTATTNAFVHLRAGDSTSTNILLNLNGGTQVDVLSVSNADWQEVEYQGVIGYIFKTYLEY